MHNLLEEKQFLIQTLQDISHQLKTPLSTLTVNNDILLQGKLNEQQYHFYTIMKFKFQESAF